MSTVTVQSLNRYLLCYGFGWQGCNLRMELTLMLQLGGYFTPRRTFYPVAPKPLRIVTKAIVTFPEYMWAKKC